MKKVRKPKTESVARTYIKLPLYIGQYMTSVHGSTMRFSSLSRYSFCLRENVVCNKELSGRYTNLSYSDYAVRCGRLGEDMSRDLFVRGSIPTAETLGRLFAVCLPDDIDITSDVGSCQFCQLTRHGAQLFRELAHDEFWRALHAYIEDGVWEFRRENPGSRVSVSRKDLIIRFMSAYRIDIDCYENISRNYQREVRRA